MQYTDTYCSPLGGITLAGTEEALTGLWFNGQKYYPAALAPERAEKELPVFRLTKKWLDLYFQGKSRILRRLCAQRVPHSVFPCGKS